MSESRLSRAVPKPDRSRDSGVDADGQMNAPVAPRGLLKPPQACRRSLERAFRGTRLIMEVFRTVDRDADVFQEARPRERSAYISMVTVVRLS